MATEVKDKVIKNFRDLIAWKESRRLFSVIYKSTSKMPPEELYSTVSQMRRAAMSVSSNLAEGFGRESAADKVHFYVMARGSLTEVQNQAILANDVGLIDNNTYQAIEEQSTQTHKLIVGLVKSTKKRTK